MPRFCIMLVLLAVSSIAFSQAFRIEADNEPLSKVLNRLGLEISFDDRALSTYGITVSQSFDNPEKALTWLLEDKPFRIEKIEQVYVIAPHNRQPDHRAVVLQNMGNERFVFKGSVFSETVDEPLEYATVSFLDADNNLLIAGITNDKGRFAIQVSRVPAKIKISHIGYETQQRNIDNLNDELGIFLLSEKAISLNEIVITTDILRSEINHTTYIVTPQMRHGTDNALELLNKIPGTYFDKTSKSVRLNRYTNILMVVDGIQSSQDYLYHLSPDRIHSVEVVYALSGRYVSDDYAGIIHFMLKKDYTGYDVHVSGISSFNLSKTADARRVEKYPDIGIIYTTRKVNLFATYSYEWERRNLFSSKSLTYNASEYLPMSAEHPNNLSQRENHTVTGGLNYHITPLQLIGIQADFSTGNIFSLQEYAMRRTGLSGNDNSVLTNTTENRIKADVLAASVFYQGRLSNRLHLYGNFSYNYYYNDMENDYRQDGNSDYRYADFWNEYKHQTTLDLEGKYVLTDKISLESGYSNIMRRYASGSSQGRGFLDYSENRNKVYLYLSGSLTGKTDFKAGAALEHIIKHNREIETKSFRALPFLWMNYNVSRTTKLTTAYSATQAYPLLYQLSPMSIVIDTFLTRIGNPDLKFALRHHAYAELSLWNKLSITPQISIINDNISEIYERKEYKLYRTFENIRHREYSLNISYHQTLGRYLHLKNAVMLYHDEALYQGVRNSLNGWTCRTEADYYHPATSFGIQLGYYRNMKKNVLWQGYQMVDKDYWCVSVRKAWWQNRISATLSYIPPVAFGVRYDRMNEIDAPLLYKEKTAMHLKSYNQMLLLKINVRLERGSAKPAESRTDRKSDMRER